MSQAFVEKEKHSTGTSLLSDLFRLFRSLPALRRAIVPSLILIFLASTAPSFFRWYVGKLGDPASRELVPGIPFSVEGLTALAFAAAALRILAWASFELSGMWSAQGIHREMVTGLSRVRTTYFDENPSGRLINRLVRDYEEVRSTAIIFVGDCLNAGMEIISVAVVASLVSPAVLVPFAPLFWVFFRIQSHRGPMVTHSRSLAAAATGRVLDRKTDLIEGREIFAIYGRQDGLLERIRSALRESIRGRILLNRIETWSSYWIRMSAEGFSLTVLLCLSWYIARGGIDATLAGVVISALFGLASGFNWLDFATGHVAQSAAHIRRVFELVDLPPEESEEGRPTHASQGERGGNNDEIRFERYSMSYRADSPTVLKELDLSIRVGSKVALVGRTGSGKTSLVQALFRMVFVQEGRITWAGESIHAMGLSELRSRIGVAPQFPYLFSGTVRSNLDRFGAIGDPALEASMRDAGLALSLDHIVAEGGQNLSLGQRQLLCLARAIATRKPLIVLDEPTSGLDPETDARIGRVLREALANRTVITIAHRRETLASHDWVIELGEGRVLRQGTPAEILPSLSDDSVTSRSPR